MVGNFQYLLRKQFSEQKKGGKKVTERSFIFIINGNVRERINETKSYGFVDFRCSRKNRKR